MEIINAQRRCDDAIGEKFHFEDGNIQDLWRQLAWRIELFIFSCRRGRYVYRFFFSPGEASIHVQRLAGPAGFALQKSCFGRKPFWGKDDDFGLEDFHSYLETHSERED